jgi:predicted KAP-like P-loop ATPase
MRLPFFGRRETASPDETVSPARPPYDTDCPWSAGDPDDLRRQPFAARIAATILEQGAASGMVLGLYGPWGEGKTSLLRMIETSLKGAGTVETLWFNPWYFQGQEQLVQSFLGALASKLEARLGSSADEFKRVLNKYGGVVSALPVGVYGVDPGKLMTSVADRLKGSSLEALKQQLEAILAKKKIHVVVFMDDIDRLDQAEIHSVMKLVKLVGGFQHVTYILSFDDEMVANALGHVYGASPDAGRNFLEKIVQVPLRVPVADSTTLLGLALAEVDGALEQGTTPLTITKQEVLEFRRYFDPLFTSRPRTLRSGKRFGNSLTFALPLLRGEARMGDLLLVEVLRAFVPQVHSKLRGNRELLLGEGASQREASQDGKASAAKEWNSLIDLAHFSERVAVKELLVHLFPRAERFTNNTHYGPEWSVAWAADQRIASPEYFDRFFQFSVSADDVRDTDFAAVMAALVAGGDASALALFDQMLSAGNEVRIVQKFRRLCDAMDSIAATGLVRLLTKRAGELPRPDALKQHRVPQAEAAIVCVRALRRVPVAERLALARAIVESPTDLSFSAECFRYIRHHETADPGNERPRTVSAEEEALLQDGLRSRMTEVAQREPVYQRKSAASGLILSMWGKFAGIEATEPILRTRFQREPREAAQLLAAMSGQSWSMTTGMPLIPDVEREQYDAVSRLVAPSFVIEALRRAYGEAAEPGDKYEPYGDRPRSDDPMAQEARLARQFIHLERLVSAAGQQQPPVAPAG